MTIAKLNDLRDLVVNVKNKLEDYESIESISNYKCFLEGSISSLNRVLNSTVLPEFYKVAVVGRFKVGKSSFVNVLTGSEIASVSEHPETAAISIFRNANKTFADIEMFDEETWAEIKKSEHSRYVNFFGFNERKNNPDQFDLKEIESTYIKKEGLLHRIDFSGAEEDVQLSEISFSNKLKEFTSSESPLHYLVKQIIIYTPNSLIGNQVEIIDTPGLDDTERFRSELTEEILKNVDAILFLTTSGASYSNSDKEFLIRQLRIQQIKQLQIIVTKVDSTYESKKRRCKKLKEAVPTLNEFKKEEECRIREELMRTLNELLDGAIESEDAGLYYRKQLENTPIHFVSTLWYEDGEEEKSGLPEIQQALSNALSNSSRFLAIRDHLSECVEGVLKQTRKTFEDRFDAIDSNFDEVEVRSQLDKIRTHLLNELEEFKKKLNNPLEEIKTALSDFAVSHREVYLENVTQHANNVMRESLINDVALHWATRRAGNWGSDIAYGKSIGMKIADKIFPLVESILEKYTNYANRYTASIKQELSNLQNSIKFFEDKNQLSGIKQLSLDDCLEELDFDREMKACIDARKISIMRGLDSFSDDVMSNLKIQKNNIRNIAGKGTSDRQKTAIIDFYVHVQILLSKTLKGHLENELEKFVASLVCLAEGVKPKVERILLSELNNKFSAIDNKLSLINEEKKEATKAYLTEVIDWIEVQEEKFKEIKEQ